MSLLRARAFVVLAGLLFMSSPVLATDDIPLRNWTVPAQGSGQLSTLADVGAPAIFVGVTPCRVADTRGNGYSGAYGPPLLSAGVTRTFNIVASGCTGIPTGVSAFSLNFTVVGATGAGMLLAWPTGGTQPSISVLNYVTGQTVANAAIVPAGSGTSINVLAGVHATNLIIDINGYFMGGGGSLNLWEQLLVQGNCSTCGMVEGQNYSDWGYGVRGTVFGTGGGEAGVYGFAAGATGYSIGVEGYSGSATTNSTGVLGVGGGEGKVHGVEGHINYDTVNDAAGVIGSAGSLPGFPENFASAGVRGEGMHNGVVGVAVDYGLGVLGASFDAVGGTYGPWGYMGGPSYGVYSYGSMGATGAKPFVEPHPYKPGTVIRYVALEGPEAGTYFRGRGRFVGGSAFIEVPESFRLVTDEEGITVQITPMGAFASVMVRRVGLDTIEVESTGDVEFSYLVQGIRRTFKDWQVEVTSRDYMPMLPTSTIPSYLSEGQKRNLIQSGVYNEDGTVNMSTARRLGWDKVWEAKGKRESR